MAAKDRNVIMTQKKLASIMPKGAVLEDQAKPGVILKKRPDKKPKVVVAFTT